MIPTGILTSYNSTYGTLLLDLYPNALAAYSLRKLNSSYTGAAIRLRRSFDNAETDIGFTSSGDLDTTAVSLFILGTNGFISTWYDQSGNGRNATTTSRPFLALNGTIYTINGKPSAFWLNGQNYYLRTSSFTSISQPISTFSVSKLSASSGINASVLYDNELSSSNGFNIYNTGITDTPNNTCVINSGTSVSIMSSDTNINLISAIYNTTNSNVFVNNVSKISGQNIGSNALTGITIGNVRNSTFYNIYDWSGYITELVFYPTNQSSNRTGIQSNINTYYSIY